MSNRALCFRGSISHYQEYILRTKTPAIQHRERDGVPRPSPFQGKGTSQHENGKTKTTIYSPDSRKAAQRHDIGGTGMIGRQDDLGGLFPP